MYTLALAISLLSSRKLKSSFFFQSSVCICVCVCNLLQCRLRGPTLRVIGFIGLRGSLGICIVNKFPGDTDAAGPEALLPVSLDHYVKESHMSFPRTLLMRCMQPHGTHEGPLRITSSSPMMGLKCSPWHRPRLFFWGCLPLKVGVL